MTVDDYGRIQCRDCANYGLSIRVPERRHIIDGHIETEWRIATTCRLRLGHVPDKWRRCDEYRDRGV